VAEREPEVRVTGRVGLLESLAKNYQIPQARRRVDTAASGAMTTR
jgi:hypothetical protein